MPIILLFFLSLHTVGFAQNTEQFTSETLQNYITNAYQLTDDKKWLLKANELEFSQQGLEAGLELLAENLKNGKISKENQQDLIKQFVDSYINQTIIFAYMYPALLENTDTENLLFDFLRQATGQIWLEKLAEENAQIFEITPEELNLYYQANSDRLLRLGLSASQIREYAEQELKQKKIQKWTQEQISNFKLNKEYEVNPTIKKKYKLP